MAIKRDVSPNLFLVFEALMDERSVTRAAARIGLSQSAVSHALGRLRVALGDELFVRRKGGVHPTQRALQLADSIGPALADLRSAFQPVAFDPATSTDTLRMAVSEYSTAGILDRIVAELWRRAPQISLAIVVRPSAQAVDLLNDNMVDFAIGIVRNAAGLDHVKLFEDSAPYVAMARHHPLARKDMTLEAYAAARHLYVSADGAQQGMGAIDAALRTHGLKRKFAVTLTHFSLAPSVAARSDLILTLPKRLADLCEAQFGMYTQPLPIETPPLETSLVWHSRFASRPLDQWFRETMVGLFDGGR